MKGGCEQRGNLCCGGDFLRHFFFPSTLQYVRDLVKCDSLETDLDQSPAHGCQKFVERERNGAGEGGRETVLYPFANRLCKAQWRKAEWHGVSDASICQMQGILRVRSTAFHNATDFVCWPVAGVIKCLSKARILRTKLMTHSFSDKYQTVVALCFVKVKDQFSYI